LELKNGKSSKDIDRECGAFDNKKKPTVSVDEYRKILNDEYTPDQIILTRVNYLEEFCRNIIKIELQKHGKEIGTKK